ncbi:MBL fold metallo-hydrolase RNA specificity domain-containing protein [Cupriavidus oxalaticus]|jgi:metallo-beta-lactamase family protein|uniref:MBL fold metallo-hydrolase n=1 Tax=Cupriavidus oxalaticus TaxID=96344 RepID=A0A375FL67_9BURK|nr:MBL fold metallo-hydrolase [Cupriavidus oxalaticus]QRQ84226.1 MBL fold metallo-hydrolase [Cupriavidus oxalaticus]QRQ91687.1 MBL fold metallo-hydrolase [Cupriavidus oxalaticus]WQD86271.1 MBL fold metallo-hydrolase [Cupriavidus oxalaticus]SPC05191.1 putative RNA Modifying Enzyme [Cupriavidus oxalaticus]SPC17993.1 putative RNA Modifying Enzyme [Cupriavidus oxalaticus]
MQLQFLGATDTVTGSKYLLDTGRRRILVDCGLFQGYKNLRLRNWDPLPLDPANLDAVVLTHAHIDHSGYLPLLVRNGFRGSVYCTMGTAQLCCILLPDCAHLAEEDAAYANRKGFSRHRPALPLYTGADAERSLRRLQPTQFGKRFQVVPGVEAEFTRAGHIIGSAIVTLYAGGKRIVFSGDLGRQQDIVMRAPEMVRQADYLLVESTYGDRRHPDDDPLDALGEIVSRTVGRGGSLIIPAFAVGRTQSLLYCLHRLRELKRIPDVPVYLNSPMAIDATTIFSLHPEELRISREACTAACNLATPVQSMEQSIWLNQDHSPKIILAGSGMATGGRVVHHLAAYGPNPRNTILLSGFQAAGTRGAALAAGRREIRLHGKDIAVRATVEQVEHLSAHADAGELMTWLGGFHQAPRCTFVVHGEPQASDALRQHIERDLQWTVTMPEYRRSYPLD